MGVKLLGLMTAVGLLVAPAVFATTLNPRPNLRTAAAFANPALTAQVSNPTSAGSSNASTATYTNWVDQRIANSVCPNGGCLNAPIEAPEGPDPTERATQASYRASYEPVFSFSNTNEVALHDTTASLVTSTNATRYTAGFVSLPDSIAECRTIVPEPGSMLLLGIGLLGAGWLGRRHIIKR